MLHFKQSSNQISRLIWLLVSLIFIADILLPVEYHIVFAYLLAHFLAIYFKEKNDVLLLAVATSALTILGITFQLHYASFGQIFLQRLPAIISFWAAAFFVIRFINLREKEALQEERFKALFEYATNGILLANSKGQIVMANPAIEALFGYGKGEMNGLQVEALIPNRFSRQHVSHRENYQKQPKARAMGTGLNLSGLKKDGMEFSVEVSLGSFKNREGDFVVAFVIDNTARKIHEKSILKQKQELANLSSALRELNEGLELKVQERTRELEKAKNELSAALEKERELGELKSRFVSMASHEFRTPLTSVLSSASLVQQYADRADYANVHKHGERIKNAITGLNSILSEFLSLGRLEEGKVALNLEAVSIPGCIEEVVEGLSNLLKTGQHIIQEHAGPSVARIDCTLTKNVLINLVSNAIKYSPEGAPILIKSELAGEQVRISIQDKGMGIPEADQKHLFERFFRAKNAANSTQGTGLGLYIVQRYVEMMGGTVGYKSSVEEGSTFWVAFQAPAP